MLLLVMISLHVLTFRLMVIMVAEFCSLIITLLGKITVVHELQGLTEILYLYSSVVNDTFPYTKIQVH